MILTVKLAAAQLSQFCMGRRIGLLEWLLPLLTDHVGFSLLIRPTVLLNEHLPYKRDGLITDKHY